MDARFIASQVMSGVAAGFPSNPMSAGQLRCMIRQAWSDREKLLSLIRKSETSMAIRSNIAQEGSSREKLIQSAEHLFADKGFDGVSVRDIANDANVNSALVGYYFRGKEGLLTEVYTRHCEPLKRERIRLLEAYSVDGKLPTLEEILRSFIQPSLKANQGSEGKSFSRLRAILSAENSQLLEQLVAKNFDDSTRLFVAALRKCLPDLTREDVLWRFHFLLGGIYYTAVGPHRIKTLSKGKCDPSEPDATTDQLIAFAAAGFRGPIAQRQRSLRVKRQSVVGREVATKVHRLSSSSRL